MEIYLTHFSVKVFLKVQKFMVRVNTERFLENDVPSSTQQKCLVENMPNIVQVASKSKESLQTGIDRIN